MSWLGDKLECLNGNRDLNQHEVEFAALVNVVYGGYWVAAISKNTPVLLSQNYPTIYSDSLSSKQFINLPMKI